MTALVARLHAELEADFRRRFNRDLEIFFDKEDIRDFDHWQVRCHRALRDSRFFIACLSRTYLRSDACRWEWAPRVPGVLLAVVGATVVVGVFDLTARAGVSVVGPLPQGLPAFQFPAVPLGDLSSLLAAAVAIALMSFAETSVLARTFALRAGEETDDNQELIALGAANVAAGLFQGFAVSSSASRTPVAEAAGARTQLTGLVGAACIGLLLVFAPALLRHLPQSRTALPACRAAGVAVRAGSTRAMAALKPRFG